MKVQDKIFTLEESSKSPRVTKLDMSLEVLLGTMIRFL